MRADSAKIKPVTENDKVTHFHLEVKDYVAHEIITIEVSREGLQMLRYQINELLGPEEDNNHKY